MKNAQKNIEAKAKVNQNLENKRIKQEEKNLQIQMKKNQNMHFKRYVTNNLGLNTSNEKVQKILNNYNKYPNYIQNHMSEAETLKALANERRRLTNSAKMLPKDERRDKRIQNIRNANDVAQLNSDIADAYVAIIRKEITNMVLQSGVKTNINVGSINSLKKAEETRAKLMTAIEQKKTRRLFHNSKCSEKYDTREPSNTFTEIYHTKRTS